MVPEFNPDRNLPPRVHRPTWQEFMERFGTTPRRQELLKGQESNEQ